MKIGQRVRAGGGQRATVARTQAEINAARRQGGVVSTDKKVQLYSSYPYLHLFRHSNIPRTVRRRRKQGAIHRRSASYEGRP